MRIGNDVAKLSAVRYFCLKTDGGATEVIALVAGIVFVRTALDIIRLSLAARQIFARVIEGVGGCAASFVADVNGCIPFTAETAAAGEEQSYE